MPSFPSLELFGCYLCGRGWNLSLSFTKVAINDSLEVLDGGT